MYWLFLILIIVILCCARTGRYESIFPLYGTQKFYTGKFVYPEYCTNSFYNMSYLPEYSDGKVQMAARDYIYDTGKYIVNSEYMCFYSALRFADKWSGDIIYYDGFRGVVPYLLAELLGKKIYYVTKKKPIIEHKNMIICDERDLPRNCNLIYFAIYAPTNWKFWPQAHSHTHTCFMKVYERVKPPNFLFLTQNKRKLPRGFIHVPPFSFIGVSAMYLITGTYNKNYAEIDPRSRLKIFTKCRRANGEYDLWFAHSTLAKYTNKTTVFNLLGPLPKNDEKITILWSGYDFKYTGVNDLEKSQFYDVHDCGLKLEFDLGGWPVNTAGEFIYSLFLFLVCKYPGENFVKRETSEADLRLQSFIKLIYNDNTPNIMRNSQIPKGELIPDDYMHPKLMECGELLMQHIQIPQYRVWLPDEKIIVSLFAKYFPKKILCVVGRTCYDYINVVCKPIPEIEKNDCNFL
jgi:hypothetical protein